MSDSRQILYDSIRPIRKDDIPSVCDMLGRAFHQGGELEFSLSGSTPKDLSKFFEYTVRGHYKHSGKKVKIDVTDDLEAMAL